MGLTPVKKNENTAVQIFNAYGLLYEPGSPYMQNRKTILTMVLAGVVFLPSCSPFQFEHHASFGQWYRGKSGFDRALVSSSCPTLEERHWLYLHFRLPELIFNPQGGLRYPERCFRTQGGGWAYAGEGVVTSSVTDHFTGTDDGLVEILFSYRSLNVESSVGEPMEETHLVRDSLGRLIIYPVSLIPRLPSYAIHDIVKTAMIPYALVHYTMIGETTLKDNMRIRMEQRKIIAMPFFYVGNSRAQHLFSLDVRWRGSLSSRTIGFVKYAPKNARIHILGLDHADVSRALEMANLVASELKRRGIPEDRLAEPRARLMNEREKSIHSRSDMIHVVLMAAPAESRDMYEETKDNSRLLYKRTRWSDLEP